MRGSSLAWVWGLEKHPCGSLNQTYTQKSVWKCPALRTFALSPYCCSLPLPPPEGDKFIHSWSALSVCVLHGYCYLCVFFPLLPHIAVHCRYRCTSFPSRYSLDLIACSLETSAFCLQILFPIAVLFLERQSQMSPARVGALARLLHRCSEHSRLVP